MLSRLIHAAALMGLVALCSPALAQTDNQTPFPAHHVAGNVYFVGSKNQAVYLITTPQGNILINSGVQDSPAQIKAGIEKLGFKYADTKILLISHAHFDHDAGSARIVRETGAKY
jgi:metallo-beta-lactamase class B